MSAQSGQISATVANPRADSWSVVSGSVATIATSPRQAGPQLPAPHCGGELDIGRCRRTSLLPVARTRRVALGREAQDLVALLPSVEVGCASDEECRVWWSARPELPVDGSQLPSYE